MGKASAMVVDGGKTTDQGSFSSATKEECRGYETNAARCILYFLTNFARGRGEARAQAYRRTCQGGPSIIRDTGSTLYRTTCNTSNRGGRWSARAFSPPFFCHSPHHRDRLYDGRSDFPMLLSSLTVVISSILPTAAGFASPSFALGPQMT